MDCQIRRYKLVSIIIALILAFLIGSCKTTVNSPTEVPFTPSETDSFSETPALSPIPTQSDRFREVSLVESRHQREEAVPRLFNSLVAQNDFATFTFELAQDIDRSQIEQIYKTMLESSKKILGAAQTEPQIKSEFLILNLDGNGREFTRPSIIGDKIILPYSMMSDNEYLGSMVKGFFPQAEPWVAYGLSGYLKGDQTEVDKSLIADTDKLFLSGVSFTMPFVSKEDFALSKSLATAFLNYLVEKEGKSVISELLTSKPSVDIYASLKAWSGESNSLFDSDPQILAGKYNYADILNYDLVIGDDKNKIYFKRGGNEDTIFDSPSKIYSFLDRFHNAYAKIESYAKVNGLKFLDTGLRIFTVSVDRNVWGGYTEGSDIYFGNGGWRLTLEHELTHALLYVNTISSKNHSGWLIGGLGHLLTNDGIFGQEVFELSGFPQASFYNIMRDVKSNKLKSSDFTFPDGLESFKNAVAYYTRFASLDDPSGELDYKLFADSAAYAWLQKCEKSNVNPTDIIGVTMGMRNFALLYEAHASYVNYLVAHTGHSIPDLIRITQDESGVKELEKYASDWLKSLK